MQYGAFGSYGFGENGQPRPSACREEGAMRFGLFGSAEAGGAAAGVGRGQGFRNYVEYNVEAEALG